MKKKIISSILSLAMLLSLLPVAAFAADTAPATEPGTVVTKDDESVILANYNSDLASAPWTSAKLEITSVTAANVQNSTPKTVNISLTVDDLRAHENKEGTRGYWIGIGVPQVANNTYKTGWGNGTDTTGSGTVKDDEQLVGQSSKYDTFYWGSDATKLVGDNKQGYIEVTNNSVVTRYVITFHVTVAPAEITDMGFFASADKANAVIGALKGSDLTDVDVCAPDTMYVAVDQLCGPLHNYIATLTGPDNTILKYNSSTATGANVFDYDNGDSGKYVLYFTFDKTVANGSWVYSGTNTRVGAADGKYTFKLYTLPEESGASSTVPSGNDAVVAEKSITLASVTVKKDATPANDVVVYFNKDAKGANQVSIADLLGNKTIAEPADTENQSFLGWVINDNDDPISTEALKALTTKPTASVVYKAKMAQTVNVSFDVNGATAGSAPAQVKVAKDGKLTREQVTSIGTAAAALSKTGYIFDGWATRSGTAGSSYTKVDLATSTFSENTTLYAQWKSDSIATAVLKNSGTAVPSAPIEVSVTGNTGVLKITGALPALTDGEISSGRTYDLSYILDSVKNNEEPTPVETLKVKITAGTNGKAFAAAIVNGDGTAATLTIGDITYSVNADTVVAATVEAATETTLNTTDVVATPADKTALETAYQTGKIGTATMDALVAEASTDSALLSSMAAKAETESIEEYTVEVFLDVKATSYTSTGTDKALKLEITPKARLVDTNTTPTPVPGTETTISNFTASGNEAITITVPMPAGFIADSTELAKVFVKHGTEYIKPEVGSTTTSLVFKATSFSPFEIIVSNVGSVSVTFNGEAGGAVTMDLSKIGTNLNDYYTKTAPQGKQFAGWSTSSAVNATVEFSGILNEAGLKKLVDAGTAGALTLYPVFTDIKEDDPPRGGGGGVSSNVTIDRPTNGKVTVTPTAPSKGATVTINLTPDTGYAVGTVTVTDKDGKAVELTKVNDTQYTFVMPDGKVTVKATFTQVETPSSTGFTDVAADAYYADAVKWAVEKGITNGLTATTFGPNNSCTRGQMVTFLWRAAGSPAATGTNSFSDVASGEYYYNAVLWAVEKGITNGTSATTFSPNATVNRGQTVTFLYRYAESPAATGDTSFTDVAADAFYADAVKWAVAEEITNGTSSTTFSPASNCTRGQIVTFMYRQMAE